jgi:hypothetical protein
MDKNLSTPSEAPFALGGEILSCISAREKKNKKKRK